MKITISAKNARLEFQGCSEDYIKNVCHGRCCWTTIGGKTTTSIYAEPDQRVEIIKRGGVFGSDGVIKTGSDGKCIFQEKCGTCKIHPQRSESGVEVKPRSCYISPWILTPSNKLIIRNRYRLLRCFKADPKLPAYIAFASGLRMAFGDVVYAAIKKHFDSGGGDFEADMPQERFDLIKRVMHNWHEVGQGVVVPEKVKIPPRPQSATNLTPVEKRGVFFFKRDDFAADGLGAKARFIRQFLTKERPKFLTTACSRTSVQMMVAAKICAELGVAFHAFVAASKEESPEISIAKSFRAEIHEERPGYLTVVNKRMADFATANKAAILPFGLQSAEAVELIKSQAANIPQEVRRVVVCGGSGTTAAGVVLGCSKPVLVVCVGKDPQEFIAEMVGSEIGRAKFVFSKKKYEQQEDGCEFSGVALDPIYEAKLIPFLTPGDLLWVSGHREKITGKIS